MVRAAASFATVLEIPARERVRWAMAVAALVALAAAAWLAWAMGSVVRHPAAGAAGVVGLLAAATAGRLPPGALRFDGQQWWHASAGLPTPGHLDVAVDLGRWMLLRFRPDAGRRLSLGSWWPVGAGSDPARWHALRCTVYSPEPAGVAEARPLPPSPSA